MSKTGFGTFIILCYLSKEEYILTKEKEKAEEDRKVIDGSAEEVVKMQDEFLDYLSKSKFAEAFSDHIENIDLRQIVHQYSEQEKDNKKILAQSWQEFNSCTSDFFSSYRISKELLWNEIQQARKTQRYNKKRLENLIYDITDSTDFFLVKVIYSKSNGVSCHHQNNIKNCHERIYNYPYNPFKPSRFYNHTIFHNILLHKTTICVV